MLRKIFLSMILVLAVISFNAQTTEAARTHIYIGTSPATGRDCHVVLSTIHWEHRRLFSVTLATYRQGSETVYIDYTFREYAQGRGVEFSNSQGFSGWIDKYETPIEYNTWVLVHENYNPYNRR